MQKPLLGEKIAILVANGFEEKDLVFVQRKLQALGANMRIISMDQGLVNAWNGTGWGLHFAADKALNTALAADFSMLVVPGGERSVNKLKLTAHTQRFINGFVDTDKPCVMMGQSVELLGFAGKISGRTIAGPQLLKDVVEQASGTYVDEPYTRSGNLMTGRNDADSIEAFVDAISAFFCNPQTDQPLKEAA